MHSYAKLRSVAGVLPVLICLGAVFARQSEQRVFKVKGSPSVTVRNISGNIEIHTWDLSAVKVVARKSSDSVQVEMEQSGDNIRILTKRRGGRRGFFRSHSSIDYSIVMPREGNLEANTISGDVSVEDLRGDLFVESISGDLDLRRVDDRLWAKSVSGEIELSQGTVDVELSTISGDVNISEIKGRLEAHSVSGSIRVRRSQAPRFTFETTSGDVEVDSELLKGGSYHISSHSGYIAIYLSADASFELSARTFSGELDTDLPLTITTPQRGRRRGRSVRGSYGAGEATLELRTFSGDIRIIKK